MRYIAFFLLSVFFSCGPDPIPVPEPSLLLAPSNLNTCNSATRINDLERQVRFQWTATLNTESYNLVVQNTLTGEQQTITTYLLTESIVLTSGTPYQWYVISKSSLTLAEGKSSIWHFYLEGNPQESHFPFPAILLVPSDELIVSLNASNAFTFEWEGNDLDNDIQRYDFYLGTSSSSLNKEREAITSQQVTLVLIPNTIYFWQIISKDLQGNQSTSEIYQFQTQ
tara:strand:- start:203 stop:877 length:675 start_codon:yes stop_codon:yes gene_type:complete